jgi:GNAT superfamily N-acetyltransferase
MLHQAQRPDYTAYSSCRGAIDADHPPADIEAVAAMLREYTTWAFSFEAGSDDATTFEGLEEELATMPGVYAPPGGRLLLATWNGEPAACIALKPHDGTTGELKRLYVQPSIRGHEIERHLVETLVAEARTSGYRQLVLDSHHATTRAHDLQLTSSRR